MEKQVMNRFYAGILVAMLTLLLTSCGGSEQSTSNTQAQSDTAAGAAARTGGPTG